MALRKELQEILDTYVASYVLHDPKGCAAVFEPDAVLASPYGPPARGRSEIEAVHVEWTAHGGENKRMDIVECGGNSTVAWCLARYSEGCYVLRTNVNDWTAEVLWQTYVQLTQAEAAFRIHKSELSIRPVWHQKKERVQAHIFVCFLAYVMWKTLEQWQQRAGLGNSPRTILDEFARLQSADIVIPLAEDSRREIRLRCVVRPEKSQAQLLAHLGLRLPERLRVPATTRQM